MAALDVIGPLITGMKMRADMAGLACEALNRMFQREQTELVAQVNTCNVYAENEYQLIRISSMYKEFVLVTGALFYRHTV